MGGAHNTEQGAVVEEEFFELDGSEFSENQWNQSNQRHQRNQDKPRINHTETKDNGRTEGDSEGSGIAHPAYGYGSSGSTGSHSVSLSDRLAAVRTLGRVTMEESRGKRWWRVAFDLARVFRAEGDDPRPFQRAAEVVFAELDINPEDGWDTVVAAWDRILHPDGLEPWRMACAKALSKPLTFAPDAGPYATLATAAYHLSVFHEGAAFPFPVKNVAKSFGLPVPTASRRIICLQTYRLLACVKKDYSYSEGVAKEYRFIGKVMPS